MKMLCSTRALRARNLTSAISSLSHLKEAAWDVAIPVSLPALHTAPAREQHRWLSLAQQAIIRDHRHVEHLTQAAAPHSQTPAVDEHHRRRLAELEKASTSSARVLPSAAEVAERLRSHAAAGCSNSSRPAGANAPAPQGADAPPLSWQSIVAALRQGDMRPADTSSMLTDLFRCEPDATCCLSCSRCPLGRGPFFISCAQSNKRWYKGRLLGASSPSRGVAWV